MNLFPDIRELVANAIHGQIQVAHTRQVTARVDAALNLWLVQVRKKNVPNLEQRMMDFRKRIGVLAAKVELAYSEGRIVVKATGDADTTLRMIKRGTDWFDPADDADKLIAGAMLNE
jgi:hypothetical protein